MTLADTYIFRRVEKKYLIDLRQKEALISLIGDRLIPDSHGVSTVFSLYLDTENFMIIRNSIDAVSYKEKLRIRSYGIPRENSRVFFEIKKKLNGVVYKRRVTMSCGEALGYVSGGDIPISDQIMREIDYSMHFYGMPQPRVAVLYDRDAYDVADSPGLRLTFDANVRYRRRDLCSADSDADIPILPEDMCVFEVKTEGAMPCELSYALEKCGIYSSSFSKYGTAYADMLRGGYVQTEQRNTEPVLTAERRTG